MDPTIVSVSEAAVLTERSHSWVRSKLKKLAKDGQAIRNGAGAWEINRAAILAHRGNTRKGASAAPNQNTPTSEWPQVVATMKEQIADLREDNKRLIGENTQLRAELTATLNSKNKDGLLSRWLRL